MRATKQGSATTRLADTSRRLLTHPANLGKGLLEVTRVDLVAQARNVEVVSGVRATAFSASQTRLLAAHVTTRTLEWMATHLSAGLPGLLLLLERRGGSPPRGAGERASLFQVGSSAGPPLDMGASVVGMLMPPPLLGGAMSWDCQAGGKGRRGGRGGNEVRSCH